MKDWALAVMHVVSWACFPSIVFAGTIEAADPVAGHADIDTFPPVHRLHRIARGIAPERFRR